MQSLAHFLSVLGSAGLGAIWFPIAIWTLASLLISGLFKLFEDHISAVHNYHGRVALLWGLAAGVISSVFLQYLPAFFSATKEISARFIVIQNPISVSASAGTTTAIQWSDPALWFGAVTLLIIILALAAFIKLLVDFRALHLFARNLCGSAPKTDAITETNRQLLHDFDGQIDVFLSDNVAVPCTFGWYHKHIVIPRRLASHPEKLNMALRHELSHIKNNDFLINGSIKIILALFFFHPLVHYLAAKIDEYREIYCDQHVLQGANISQKQYARLLFELSPCAVFKTAAVNMAVHPSTLKKRIQIMKTSTPNIPSFKWSMTLVAISTLLITGLMACSDMEDNGITQSEVQKTQANINHVPTGDQPLFVVNGEKMTSKKLQLSRLDPKYIKSIDVLKGKSATDIYGPEGKNGVVNIALSVDKQEAFNHPLDKTSKPVQLKNHGDDIYLAVEQKPQVIGGQQAVYKNLSYPTSCKEAGVEGRVFVQFIVNKQGDVENPQIVKGIGSGCDKAALNAIKQAKFKPGRQEGKAVNVRYTWPVTFKL